MDIKECRIFDGEQCQSACRRSGNARGSGSFTQGSTEEEEID
jgi:hypothetical protein